MSKPKFEPKLVKPSETASDIVEEIWACIKSDPIKKIIDKAIAQSVTEQELANALGQEKQLPDPMRMAILNRYRDLIKGSEATRKFWICDPMQR